MTWSPLLEPNELAAAKTASDATSPQPAVADRRHGGHRRQHRGRHREHRPNAQASSSAAAASPRGGRGQPPEPGVPSPGAPWPWRPRASSATRTGTPRCRPSKAAEAHERAARDQMAAAEAALKAAPGPHQPGQGGARNVKLHPGPVGLGPGPGRRGRGAPGLHPDHRAHLRQGGHLGRPRGRGGQPGHRHRHHRGPGPDLGLRAVPETQADAVQLGDRLKVRMPGGAVVDGKVIVKSRRGRLRHPARREPAASATSRPSSSSCSSTTRASATCPA